MLHGGDALAQALVDDALVVGAYIRTDPNFFGHSQLDALMGLPTAEGRLVLDAFGHIAKSCDSFVEAEDELHRLICCRWMLVLSSTPMALVQRPTVSFPELSRQQRLEVFEQMKKSHSSAFEESRSAKQQIEFVRSGVTSGPRAKLW